MTPATLSALAAAGSSDEQENDVRTGKENRTGWGALIQKGEEKEKENGGTDRESEEEGERRRRSNRGRARETRNEATRPPFCQTNDDEPMQRKKKRRTTEAPPPLSASLVCFLFAFCCPVVSVPFNRLFAPVFFFVCPLSPSKSAISPPAAQQAAGGEGPEARQREPVGFCFV